MIQELTDCGPSRTYPVYYLEDAMNNLGDYFDYAVNDYRPHQGRRIAIREQVMLTTERETTTPLT